MHIDYVRDDGWMKQITRIAHKRNCKAAKIKRMYKKATSELRCKKGNKMKKLKTKNGEL